MKKLISMVLAACMVLGSFAMAFADTNVMTVNFADGSKQVLASSNNIKLMDFRSEVPDHVVISQGGETKLDASDFSKNVSVTLPAKTTVTLYTQEASGIKSLYLKYDALRESFDVSVSAKPAEFTAYTNTGVYGQNRNMGGSPAVANVTGAAIEQTMNAQSGFAYSAEFTPVSGQEITAFNIRVGASDASGRIVTNLNSTETVNGMRFVIKGDPSKASVSCSEVFANIFVTALTKDAVARYSFSASASGGISAKVDSAKVEAGKTASAVFTSSSGAVVGDIVITSGGQSGTIPHNKTSVSVNGMTFTRSGSANSVTVRTSALTADASVKAYELSDGVMVSVDPGKYASSNQKGDNVLQKGDDFTVRFTAEDYADMEKVVITVGGQTYSADAYSRRIVAAGASYSMSYAGDTLSVYLTDVDANMTVSVKASSSSHKVTVKADSNISVDSESFRADSGRDVTVRFVPRYDAQVKKVAVEYLGEKKTVYPDDTYVKIDGIRHPVSMQGNVMYITLKGLEGDASFNASSLGGRNFIDNNDWIAASEDAHTSISLSTTDIDKGDSVTVYVSADKKYEITYVDLRTATDSARIVWGDKNVTIDGRTFKITYSGGTMRIALTAYKEIEVRSYSVAEGSEPVIPASTGDYHGAYIAGFPDGTFRPENRLTKAQAIAMLTRIFAPTHPSYSSSYKDVIPGSWYYDSVAYAERMGYTKVLSYSSYLMPDAEISRAEYLALLCQYSGRQLPSSNNAPNFKDVPSTHPLARYISAGYTGGLAAGYGDGTFRPDRTLSRAEAVAFTNRALGRVNCPGITAYMVFTDVPYTHWAFTDIYEAAVAHSR